MASFLSTSRIRRQQSHHSTASSSHYESDDDGSCTSDSSVDEEYVNRRLAPNWCSYRTLVETRGFRLDTCKDVKQWYQDYWARQVSEGRIVTKDLPGYLRACRFQDENELCRDDGLPDRLFRGTQCSTGVKVVIKAVHLSSREYDVIRFLSCPSMRNFAMNHCIPVLDLIEVPTDNLAFIVMEEWASHLHAAPPVSLGQFCSAMRQCIEHIAFMHAHHIAHLDISRRNLLTDGKGHYACIDYELSARYDNVANPRVGNCPRTEVPPELERGELSDPFKVDVYALGMTIIQGMDTIGLAVPQLYALAKQMCRSQYQHRPTALQVLHAFDATVATIYSSGTSTVTYHTSSRTL
ncbi:kinase-like domain-containing protein [Daedaleopsis nitida]|nr:kinase-like domain-containing protein [Daedaleopsis nitida]